MKAWSIITLLSLAVTLPLRAAEPPGELPLLPSFSAEQPGQPRIISDIMPIKPFSVIGPRGALLGQQDGSFEAWVFPWKIFANMRITAIMKDYAVPIDVNEQIGRASCRERVCMLV